MCDMKGEDQVLSENAAEETLKSGMDIEEDGSSDTKKSEIEETKETPAVEPFSYSSPDVNFFIDARNGDVINVLRETNDDAIMRDQKFGSGRGRGHLLGKSMDFSKLQSQLRKIHPLGLGNSVIESYFSKTAESETETRIDEKETCEKRVAEQEANGRTSITKQQRTALSRNVLLSSLLSRKNNSNTDS